MERHRQHAWRRASSTQRGPRCVRDAKKKAAFKAKDRWRDDPDSDQRGAITNA